MHGFASHAAGVGVFVRGFSILLRSALLHLSCKLVLMKIHVVLGKVREQQGFVIYLDKVIDYANFKTVKMMPCSF